MSGSKDIVEHRYGPKYLDFGVKSEGSFTKLSFSSEGRIVGSSSLSRFWMLWK